MSKKAKSTKKTKNSNGSNSKKTTKNQQKNNDRTTYFLIGLTFVILGILGILRLGFLGALITNVFRAIVGNAYLLMGIFLILYGLVLMLMGRDPSFKRKSITVGLMVFGFSLLLFMHIGLIKQIDRGTNVIGVTWDFIAVDIRTNKINQPVGGGMIGALIYTVTYFLVSKFGSILVALAGMLTGILLIFNIGVSQVADLFSGYGHRLQSSVDQHKKKKKR